MTRSDGTEQDELNELEMIDGLVCCNIWYSDEIICVDPQTGSSVKEIGEYRITSAAAMNLQPGQGL